MEFYQLTNAPGYSRPIFSGENNISGARNLSSSRSMVTPSGSVYLITSIFYDFIFFSESYAFGYN